MPLFQTGAFLSPAAPPVPSPLPPSAELGTGLASRVVLSALPRDVVNFSFEDCKGACALAEAGATGDAALCGPVVLRIGVACVLPVGKAWY